MFFFFFCLFVLFIYFYVCVCVGCTIANVTGYGTGSNAFYPTSLISTAGMALKSQTNDIDPATKVSQNIQNHYFFVCFIS